MMQHSMEHLEASARRTRAAEEACQHPMAATGMLPDGRLYCQACGCTFDVEDPAVDYTGRLEAALRTPEARSIAAEARQAAEALRVDALLCVGRA